MIHNEILDALKEKNCFSLLSCLSMYTELPKDFALMDDNTGKTLQQLIQESKIDFNAQYLVEYDFDEIITLNITPIQRIFTNLQKGEVPEIKQLGQLLLLGANVNQEIDNEGNTVLHKYLPKGIHPTALRELIKAGGDIYKKNHQGKTPLDLTDSITSKYLLELQNEYNLEHSAATKMQRQWRLMKKFEPKSIELNHNNLPLFSKKPFRSNPPNAAKMKLWIESHKEEDRKVAEEVAQSIQHISFDRFLFGLKMAVNKFNLYLHSLPEDKKSYALLVDSRKDKSGPWVTKLAQQYLAFPPTVIINTEEIQKFDPTIDLSHIVFFDDASYSGNLLYKFQKEFYTLFLAKNIKCMALQLHLIVPFTTERARERFSEFPTLLYTQEIIPSFKIKGTFFKGETATYFDHKIPVDLSTIECIENGKLITGEGSGVSFVEPMIPPYKF